MALIQKPRWETTERKKKKETKERAFACNYTLFLGTEERKEERNTDREGIEKRKKAQ